MRSENQTGTDPITRFILLSDIAHSSKLAEAFPQEYTTALDKHNALVEKTLATCNGVIYKNTGDGYYAFFESSNDCIACAHKLALAFARFEPLADDAPFLVRIALHGGELRPAGNEFFGPALNRVSRICQVCHPGQTIISGAVQGIAQGLRDGTQFLDLGLHHLRDLSEPEQLFQLDDKRLPMHEFPALETLNNRPHNLWKHNDNFIGRGRELSELQEQLRNGTHLISIVGLGGYGKSRISLQLLADLLPEYANGAFFVDLEPLSDPINIPSAVARAMGFNFAGSTDPAEQLIAFLRAKEMLICFDNFEHIMEGREFVNAILKGAPKVQIIVTTREPLRIKGELLYQLDPLGVSSTSVPGDELHDDTRSDAGATPDALLLFADRASLVNPGFSLTPENANEVATICRILSGIPLAIELAAAWMDSFTLAELMEELKEQLELEARYEDVPGRHKSLRASMDWSWNLLEDGQRETLMRMATFRGGAFAEAAGAVLGLKGMQLRKALAGLMDKSWLSTRGSGVGVPSGWVAKAQVAEQTRWHMRDTASHEYAFQKLEGARDEPDDLYESAIMAHVGYFSALVEREGPRLEGDGTPTGQMEALATFEVELENIIEAIDSLLQCIGSTSVPGGEEQKSTRKDAGATSPLEPSLLPIVRWLWLFQLMKGKAQNQLLLYKRLECQLPTSTSAELHGWANLGIGYACWRLGMMEEAKKHADACIKLAQCYRLPHLEAIAQNLFGIVHSEQGRTVESRECYEAFLAISLELGDRRGEGASINNLGNLHMNQGRMDEARECYEATLTIMREIGNLRGEGISLQCLGNLHLIQGWMEQAQECYEKSLIIFRQLGDDWGEGASQFFLGDLHRNLGRIDEAQECYESSLAIKRELGFRSGEASCLNVLGILHKDQRRIKEARECFEASLEIDHELGDQCGQGNTFDSYAGLLLETGELLPAKEMLEQCQYISDKLSMKGTLARLHSKWAQYWLLVFRGRVDTVVRPTGGIPTTPQVALAKALSHIDIAKGFQADIGGNWQTEAGQEITTARRAIIEFAKGHGLAESVADLIDEQQAEDAERGNVKNDGN